MALVAGIDSSTQSCKVVVRDADSGALIRSGRAPHPDATEVDPRHWWQALEQAIAAAGGLDDVAAVAVAAQQHGMVCLGEDGEVVRPALLWNDTRSAGAADALVEELGGPRRWAEAVGSVPVASFTITKLRWLAEQEPEHAARTAAVCLPHDWLTWRLAGATGLDALTTDRGDASGTGYFSPADDRYRLDLLERALGHRVLLPRVLGPLEVAGQLASGAASGQTGAPVLAAGTGDNMAAGLALELEPGDVVVSLGTSGTAFARSTTPTADPSGLVAGFASASGDHLPLVCTLNAARVLEAAARLLGVSYDQLDELAMSAPAGADGLVVVPYLEGERTPNLPTATGAIHGLTLATSTPAHLARAAVEGMLCGLADAVDALVDLGVEVERVVLVGGAAASRAVREIAPRVLARPVVVPPAGEYVADGAARQAAGALTGSWPHWESAGVTERSEAAATPGVRERYAEARAHHLEQIH
ncbi:MAG: xylulokinase [Nitriliruptoraceae bacterium]